jgi:hypothetical protein
MRPFLPAFFFICLFSLSDNINAQFQPSPGGKTWVYQPLYMIKLSKKKKFNPKSDYEIRVVLLNDSVIYTGAKLDTTSSGKKALKFNGKVITPAETKEIVFPIEEGEFLKGLPRDSCWIFKTTAGLINAYSATPETDNKNILALQKLSGEIFPFTKELLLEWLKSDPKAVKLAEKDKFVDAIKLYNQ